MSNHHRPRQGTGIAVSHFHLVDPLPVSVVLDGPEMEKALIMEALNRGAGTLQLFRTLKAWRAQRQRRHPRTVFGLMASDDILGSGLAGQADGFLVSQCREDYDRTLRDEFSSLPLDVQLSFTYEKHEAFAYYCQMRPVFYGAGYNDPCGTIFLKIGSAEFLGHDVEGGLHELYRKRLAGLERELDSWSPGLAQRVSARIKGVGGFVPRYIAPKQGHRQTAYLSNHAFGLAVDIDSDWNPHIKDQEVIDVLKEITGYDFGQVLVPKEKGIPEMDRIAQTHARVREASECLRAWLNRYLPLYEAEKRKANTPTSFLPDPAADPVCEGPSEQSKQIFRLLNYHKLAELKLWAAKGIETIPLELAAAMAKLGFRWGGQYEHSKDIMHFELGSKDVLATDREPRSLEDGLFAGNEFALRMWLDNKADRN
jgi:hypothetical protein